MKPARVVFLESQRGTESLFTRGLRRGALAAGWRAEIVFLAEADGRLREKETVQAELVQKNGDIICFLMDAPLNWPDFWNYPTLRDRAKISLWYDDFYRSPRTLAQPQVWTHWQQIYGVKVGIWDGYWRRQWEVMTGGEAFPIHLAADPAQFSSDVEPAYPAWKERAVFLGTIPSLSSLEKTAEVLPSSLKRLLQDVCARLQQASWPLRPYEISQQCRADLSPKLQASVQAFFSDASTLALWNHLLWRWGKRIARLRGLQAVGEAGPLAILSGHTTECYAGQMELATCFNSGMNWVYADTRTVSPLAWSQLYCTGKWHLQITDPQSIDGGLPFRVFEAAACGVPLLSDYRAELVEQFPLTTGLMTELDEIGLQKGASLLFEAHPTELMFRGGLLQQRFRDAHTWEARWRKIAEQAFSWPESLTGC